MENDVDFEPLIEWVLEQIVVSGDGGVSIADLLALIEVFYRRNEGKLDTSGGYLINQDNAPTQDKTLGGHMKPEIDHKFRAKFWDRLKVHPDILVGNNRIGNALTLDEVLGLPIRSHTSNSELNHHEEGDAILTSRIVDTIGPSSKPNMDGTSSSNNDYQPRVSVSDDFRWQTIAGHGVDSMRIPNDEWSYLCAVAAAGAKGITIADAIRVTRQEKQYSSVHINSLELKDYIEKRQIRTPSINRPTSLLVLKKYSNQFAAADIPTEVLTQHTDPVPGHESWTGKFIDMESFTRAIAAIVKAWQIITYTDLGKKLGVDADSWQNKILRLTLQDLQRSKVVEVNTPEMGSNAFEDTIRFLRDLNETDLSRFRRTPTGQLKRARKFRFNKPRKSTEQSDMTRGNAEEDEISLIEFSTQVVQAAEGANDPFLKDQNYTELQTNPKFQESVKINSEGMTVEKHVVQGHILNQNEGLSDCVQSQQLKAVTPPAESVASSVPRRTNRSLSSRSIHRNEEAEKLPTPKLSDTEQPTPNSVAVSRTPKRPVGRPPKNKPPEFVRPAVSKAATLTAYDDYMRQDGVPGVYFNVSEIPRPPQAARKKKYMLAVFVSKKLKDIPWMHIPSTIAATSEKHGDEFEQGPLLSQTLVKDCDSTIPSPENPRPLESPSDAVEGNNTVAAESIALKPADALVAPETSQHRVNNVFAISSSGISTVNREHSYSTVEMSSLNTSFQRNERKFPHSSSENELYPLGHRFVGIMRSCGTSSQPTTPQSQSSRMVSYVSPYKSPYITRPEDTNAETYSSPYKSPQASATPSLLSNQYTLPDAQPSFSALVASHGFQGVRALAVPVNQNLHSVSDAGLVHENIAEQSTSQGNRASKERSAQNKATRQNITQGKVAQDNVAEGKTIRMKQMQEEAARRNLAQEKVIQERLMQEKIIEERLYTSIQTAEIATPSYSSCSLACSKDGVAGVLFLTEDKTQLKFASMGLDLNVPMFILRISNITSAPSTSAPGSKPMELLLHTGDPEDATATVYRFRFLENNQSLQAANNLRAKLVTAMTVGQFKTTSMVKSRPEKDIKPFKCATCVGSWKNSEGLRYHQSKAQTTCNPNWKGKPIRASRPPKTPSSVSEARKNINRNLTGSYQDSHQGSFVQSSPESNSPVPGRGSPDVAETVISQSHILESHNPALKAGTELQMQPAESEIVLQPSAIAGTVGISHDTPGQTPHGLVSCGHFDYQTPSNLPSSHSGRTDLPQLSLIQERSTVFQNRNLILTGASLPPERRKIVAAHPSFGDTQRQKVIIKSLLEANGGVFVGDEGLWYAIVAAWVRDFPNTVIPDQKYCKEAVQLLEDDKSIIRHLFTFKDVIGVMQTRSIIMRPSMESFDPKSMETKREIKKAYPDPYIPAKFAPSDGILSKLKGRSARFSNCKTSSLGTQYEALMFGDDVEYLNDQSGEKTLKRSQKRGRRDGSVESLTINRSETERGHEGSRKKSTRHWTEEAKEQHLQRPRERWRKIKHSGGKGLASGTDAHLQTWSFSSLSTQSSLDDDGSFNSSGSNSHQDQYEGQYLASPLTMDWSGGWTSSDAFIQDPHTGAWSQKVFTKEGSLIQGGFPEPVTYLQSPPSTLWNFRPVGHDALLVNEKASRRRNARSSSSIRPTVRKQPKLTAGRKRKGAADLADLDDENLLEYTPQQEESAFLTEKSQPGRTKRQYNKSGRYSKRNQVSKAPQPEHVDTQFVNRFRHGLPKRQSVWRHYTRLADDQETVQRENSRLKFNSQALAYSQEYSRRLQALRRGYPDVRFLDPNTALYDGTDTDERLFEVGFKEEILVSPQVFEHVIDEGLRQHHVFQFQAPIILRGDQGDWPDLAETIFEEGSYSMQGWLPSAAFILRHNLPYEVETIYRKDWKLKVPFQEATFPDPQYVRFATEICQVEEWEQGIVKDLLQIGTVAPNYIFFNHTIDSLKRTDEAPKVEPRWLPQLSFTLDSIPYDELGQHPDATALSVTPALATHQRHRKRKTVVFLSDETQDQETQESDFEDENTSEVSKRYPRRRAKRVRYTIPPAYFTEPVAAPTISYPEVQYPNFSDFDIRDPDFQAENLEDEDISDRDFQDQEDTNRQRRPTQRQQTQNQLHAKSLQKSRRQVAAYSDLIGLHTAISKDPNFEVEIDFATSSVGRRRSRKLEEKAISVGNDHRIMVTVVIIRTLTGGVDKSIDWILITKQFPLYTLTSIQRRWKRLSKKHEVMLERVTSEFEDMFLEAYERNEIPSIDYDHLLDYDWKYLIDWVMEKMDSMDISLQNMHRLPTSKDKLSQFYNIQDTEASSKSVVWRDEWFNQRSAVQVRIEGVSSVQFTNSVVHKPKALHCPDDLAVAKSWLRASLLTPSESYNTEYAERKMAMFDKDLLNAAFKVLLGNKSIVSKYKGRVGPGRGYEISDNFFACLRKSVEDKDFAQAASFKTLLDAKFRAKEEVQIEWAAEDGVILALTNLQAHGRIKLIGHNIPLQSFGLIPDGFYETKRMPKMRLHFQIEVIPTESYVYDDDHQILKRLPLLAYCPPRGTRHALPVWYDIAEQLLPDMWMKVLAAVLGTMALRPGITITELTRVFTPAMDEWELRCLVEWGARLGVLDMLVEGHEGWNTGEWWWLVAGRCVSSL